MKTIKESELRKLLSADATAESALETYFELVQTGPMGFRYDVRDDVEVIDDVEEGAEEGLFGEGVLFLANAYCRHKRYKQYKSLKKSRPESKRIVSEGDSWFQHPKIEDTIDHLYAHYNIRSLGAAGDTLSNIASKREFLWEIQQEEASAFLLSGLGNDVMADFSKRLNPYVPDDGSGPRRLLRDEISDPESYSAQMKIGMLRYESIAREIGQKFPGLPMLVHGYDYVVPGEGASGRWLQEPMAEKGIPAGEQEGVVAVIIDDMDAALRQLAESFDHVKHVRCLGVAPHPWHDEIHPDDAGFAAVAAQMHETLQEVL